MKVLRWIAGSLLLLVAGAAQAHRPSDAFLTLDVHGREIRGQWEIALRDLAVVADLDRNHDNELTWGELRAGLPLLEPALLATLHVTGDGRDCSLRVAELQLNDRVDGHFAWFALEGECGTPPRELEIGYRFLFDLDPTHRGILALTAQDASHSAVLGPDDTARRFVLADPSRWSAFRDYLENGAWHIWIGYDHILFLLALLLPAVLRVSNGRWTSQPELRPALWNVLGVVTAFTLAHSVTLTLAALDVLRLPGRLVESAIAATVMLAALNNIRPVVERARWAMAFGFGLIHGFGFASVLGELGLPQNARLLALVGFNLGVEIGQLGIVVIAVPLAFSMRNTAFYRTGVRLYGSGIVVLLALWWLLQRSGVL